MYNIYINPYVLTLKNIFQNISKDILSEESVKHRFLSLLMSS